MKHRVLVFSTFVRHFVKYVLLVREVLAGLLLLIVLGGAAISRLEGLDLGQALYFAFVTGLTIGYGDITPETGGGRAVSILIGLTGLLFTGMTVAVATRALAEMVHERQTGQL